MIFSMLASKSKLKKTCLDISFYCGKGMFILFFSPQVQDTEAEKLYLVK